MTGKILAIFTAASPNEKAQPRPSATLMAGRGIEGDRYFLGTGTFSEQLKNKPAVELSLIEKEEIDSFNSVHGQSLDYGALRRNVVTENIRLNELVDKEFHIGAVKLKGIKLCEPCAHLAASVNQLVLPHMVGRSGLRAQILTDGIIKAGDVIACSVS